MPQTNLDQMTDQARALADARARLNELVTALKRGIDALHADNLPEIRSAMDVSIAAWQQLEGMVRDNPQLFVSPRKVKAHGITFGMEKGKGKLEIDDPAKTVALIKKHLPDQAEVLIAMKEEPAKDALVQLPAEQLRRVGVRLTDTGDRVVIRASDSDTDRLVRALIASALDEQAA